MTGSGRSKAHNEMIYKLGDAEGCWTPQCWVVDDDRKFEEWRKNYRKCVVMGRHRIQRKILMDSRVEKADEQGKVRAIPKQ